MCDEGASSPSSGEYAVTYPQCEHTAGRAPFGGGSARGEDTTYDPKITVVASVLCAAIFGAVGISVLIRHYRGQRRMRGRPDVEMQGRGGRAQPPFKPPALYCMDAGASGGPPPPGYAGPVVIWSYTAEEGDESLSLALRTGSLAIGKEELSVGAGADVPDADAADPAAAPAAAEGAAPGQAPSRSASYALPGSS